MDLYRTYLTHAAAMAAVNELIRRGVRGVSLGDTYADCVGYGDRGVIRDKTVAAFAVRIANLDEAKKWGWCVSRLAPIKAAAEKAMAEGV